MEQKYDVFISYSRANLEIVKSIKAEIERTAGVRCWMDLEGIESGVPRFTRSIIEGIKQCQIFLFMCSAQSQSSEFALRELNFADKRCPHIVIVHIDASQMNEEFEFLYGLTDAIDWSNLPQREKLFRDVKKWIGEYPKDDNVKFEKVDKREEEEYRNRKGIFMILFQKEAEEYYKTGEDFFYGINGKEQDYAEAEKWYNKAVKLYRESAIQGDVNAQFYLGYCLEFGKGITKNHTEALKWYRKAAIQRHRGAQDALRRIGEI